MGLSPLTAVFTLWDNKKRGSGITIAALVLAILSVVIVLASQSYYGMAIDSAAKACSTDRRPSLRQARTARLAGMARRKSHQKNRPRMMRMIS